MARCGLDSCDSKYGEVASSCERDGEHSFRINFSEFLEHLGNY